MSNPKSVAVVGGGISGVCAAAHLIRQGLTVTLFERSKTTGGVWHYNPLSAPDPPYPNQRPSLGDYVTHTRGIGCYGTPPMTKSETLQESIDGSHAPPGPCYAGLQNNVCLRQMKTTLSEWPETLGDFVSQRHLEEYIQRISKITGVDEITRFSTRVEEVRKSGPIWLVRTTTLEDFVIVEQNWIFDAVVIASGHYNMPRIPDIPGLKEAKSLFPTHVMHSKSYRSPAAFAGKRVLLIGAGVSSTDIAKESRDASKIFQSSRGGALDLPASMLPLNAIRVGGVQSIETESSFTVRLNNGSSIADIDNIVLGTGYVTSYPFLPSLHSDEMVAAEASDTVLVTVEGDMVHNLHEDIFYIDDPSLAFVGVPYHVATFSLFEFQADVIARFLAGKARLPPREKMRERYRERVRDRGLGRDFHSLKTEGDELKYVADLVGWMNTDAEFFGAEPMHGHTDIFLLAYKEQRERFKALGRQMERGGSGVSYDDVKVE